MPSWLANWQPIAIGAALMIGIALGWYVQGMRKDAYWQQHEATALIEQEKLFKRANAQSEAIGNDLQTKLTGIAAERNRLRKQASRCVPVITPAGEYNDTSNTGRAAENGVRSEWLFDFAAERDGIAAQLTACQEQLQADREANK